MKIVTKEQIREIDRLSIEAGILGCVLMENAAAAVDNEIGNVGSVRIFCGKGQNGGDGYALARRLYNRGISVEVIAVADPSSLTGDGLINYRGAKNTGVLITPFSDMTENKCVVLVDALLGTGLTGEVRGVYREAIEKINESEAYVLAVDLPSGINSDTGEVHGTAVCADKTVTFAFPKLGLYSPLSADHTGEIITANISIPRNLEYLKSVNRYLTTESDARRALGPLSRASHKGNMGRVLVIGGKIGMAGAVYMAACAAQRGGAGLTTCAVPVELLQPLMSRLTEAMCADVDDELEKRIEQSDSILVGNGMGVSQKTFDIVKKVLKHSRGRVIIDADGINVLQGKTKLLKETDAEVVLTPHMAEMSRLLGIETNEVIRNRVAVAESMARDAKVCIALKGAYTVVSSPSEMTYINSTGNVGMAVGGSGDVLAGLIAGLAAKGTSAFTSSVGGVYIHGLAGDMAVASTGVYSLGAQDISRCISKAIKTITERKI